MPTFYNIFYYILVGYSKKLIELAFVNYGWAECFGRFMGGFMSCNNLNDSYEITNAGLLLSGVASLLAHVCLVYNHYDYMMICVIICGLAIGPLTSLTPITLVEEFGIKKLSISYGLMQFFTG